MRGWLNLESDVPFFEGDSAFNALALTRTQRIYGFVACLVVGFVFSLLGSILLLLGQLGGFAVLYSVGVVVALVGTGFLIGFMSQIKLMFKPVRVVATIVFFVTIALVFVGAFVIGNGVICIVFVVLEYLAYTWYCLSYIPYARSAVLKTIGMG